MCNIANSLCLMSGLTLNDLSLSAYCCNPNQLNYSQHQDSKSYLQINISAMLITLKLAKT